MGYYNDLSLGDTHTTDDDWYDRKDYGRVVAPAAPAAPISDLLIPRACDIAARALDARESAARLADEATARQLDRLVANLPGARLCWTLGTLHIDSPSGGSYQVTRAGCSCPNGTKSHARQCWHVALHELLLDMLDTDAQTADLAAEPPIDIPDEHPDPTPGGPPPPEWHHPIPHAAAAARWVAGQQLLQTRLAATAAYLETLRAAQPRPVVAEARRLGVRLVQARRKSAYFASAFYLEAA